MRSTASPAGDLLSRVEEYRALARRAVRADVEDRRTVTLLLLDIGKTARAEPDRTIRAWAERAVWEETRGFLGADEILRFPMDDYELLQRRVRASDGNRCSRCGSHLATDADFQRWERIRRQHVAELMARERAVS